MYSRKNNNNKYHARKVKVGNIVFDSRKEANRYAELKILERAGKISELNMQVPFELVPAQREPDTVGVRGGIRRGKVIEHAVVYFADFVYKDEHGNTVVEDTKSDATKTKEYVIKRKLMLYKYNIRIREV